MGVVGRWDEDLLVRFQATLPESKARRALFGELAARHVPLAEHFVRQLTGRVSDRSPGLGSGPRRVPGAEDLDEDDARALGRLALVKVLDRLDPARPWGLPTMLRSHIVDQLQQAVERRTIVRVPAGKPRAELVYLEHDGQLGVLQGEGASGAPDGRCALRRLVEEHLVFGRGGRTPLRVLRTLYEDLAKTTGEPVVRGALARALEERGARTMTVRVPYLRRPAWGFGGVRILQKAGANLGTKLGANLEVNVSAKPTNEDAERPAIAIDPRDLPVLEAASKVSRNTIRKWAKGERVFPSTAQALEDAMERLAIKRVERPSGRQQAAAPHLAKTEPAPARGDASGETLRPPAPRAASGG